MADRRGSDDGAGCASGGFQVGRAVRSEAMGSTTPASRSGAAELGGFGEVLAG